MPHEDEFADRIMRHEGLGARSTLPPCEVCGVANASYRCLDCDVPEFCCNKCIVYEHSRNLLHRIEVRCVRHCASATNLPIF